MKSTKYRAISGRNASISPGISCLFHFSCQLTRLIRQKSFWLSQAPILGNKSFRFKGERIMPARGIRMNRPLQRYDHSAFRYVVIAQLSVLKRKFSRCLIVNYHQIEDTIAALSLQLIGFLLLLPACIAIITCVVPWGMPSGVTLRNLCVSATAASSLIKMCLSSRLGSLAPKRSCISSWIFLCTKQDVQNWEKEKEREGEISFTCRKADNFSSGGTFTREKRV